MDKFTDELQRAFQEYLRVPTAMILAFMFLGIGMAWLERSGIPWIEGLRDAVGALMFGEGDAARDILIATAATLITITSITFTVLLLAVQQAASSMSTQILDQFLRRPINHFVFGYFVGASIYSLIVLASVRAQYNPVLSTALALLFSGFALYALAVLVYVTLTQMRPAIVVQAIHDGTLEARAQQLPILRRTRREPRITDGTRIPVRSRAHGHLIYVDLEGMRRAIGDDHGNIEIVLNLPIGSYVALGDEIAEVRMRSDVGVGQLELAILRALKLGRARDLDCDPAHGIEQIVNIGWTTISSAHHSPSAGAQAVHALRSLMAELGEKEDQARGAEPDRLPIVYHDDVWPKLLRAMESLAVAATESRQHQSFGLVPQALAMMLGRLSPARQSQVEDMIRRLLSRLSDEVLTTELEDTLLRVSDTLEGAGRREGAAMVREAVRTSRSAFPEVPRAA